MLSIHATALILIIQVALVLIPSRSSALECSDFAGMTAALQSRQDWSRWCTDCGGSVRSGPKCEPGPAWGGKQLTLTQDSTAGSGTELENILQQKYEKDCQKEFYYNKGHASLRNNDPLAAIGYFVKALKAQPGDQKCRNAMALAESMRKVQHKKIMNKIIAEMEASY